MRERLWQIAAELDQLAAELRAEGAFLEAARVSDAARALRRLAGRLAH